MPTKEESKTVESQDALDPIVMLDDDEDSIQIAKACYQKSSLKNPFMGITDPNALLVYLNKVEVGIAKAPACLLLDINMPAMNGFDVLTRIRGREKLDEMPIIMLSSSSAESDKRRARVEGANSYQVKPFDIAEYVSFFNSLDTKAS